ncbi:hypothetical protein BDV25DRAFT_164780 [Aspergillus avenaceus]|uniref:Amine oxidase domain-containing protein n=1 Tax=Aspergillus avenaceus TaxID=36643 RepID=A0A5N6TGG2_ASPAV|nr:hypothetical protein BDV25DRAFT_164780 [Aspergillus avenaceus]
MISQDSNKKKTVAVIGSGMAGLVSVYLIQQDRKKRYEVEMFETQNQLSLDSASHTVTSDEDPSSSYRIDVPMRAFDDGFHLNLKRMYDHLGVQYTSPKFVYPLSTVSTTDNSRKSPPHFIHSSSNHQVPPIKPERCGYGQWILRTLYLAVCYFWFTACCFLIEPIPATIDRDDESFQVYLDRIALPKYFIGNYLLPLMSAVTTCSHDELLGFPAIDAIDYARRTYRQPHYTVVGGVQNVQAKIACAPSVRLGATVTKVEHIGSRLRVTWIDSRSTETCSKEFDHVVMAVTPNVVGAIYEPLRTTLSSIPVISGESVVHYDRSTLPDCGRSIRKFSRDVRFSPDQPQLLYICSNSSATEAIHEHPGSVLVTSFPIAPIDPAKVIHRARLARVLRTPKSRRVVNRIFSGDFEQTQQEDKTWRNGTGNVWLAGAWCWDGMVLLEGCIVSAMRVAAGLDVEVPWQ